MQDYVFVVTKEEFDGVMDHKSVVLVCEEESDAIDYIKENKEPHSDYDYEKYPVKRKGK
ncbi:hypothetical protein ACQKJG_18190 [Priestia megaterium]|uniref:hypothetical protein n=1 Tax=Priestia megaterium TaxID=1404 RepID=UPI003CFF097B